MGLEQSDNPTRFGPDDMPTPSPQPHQMPRMIGSYRIQRVLGSGGMATVYAAQQERPKRIVALKVMRTGVDAETALRRFRREVEILGRLRHAYIAQVFDAGTHDDGSGPLPYYVMEYIPGAKTILEFVAARELDLRERLKLFVKVCSAVEHGHRNKVIHRDLKPGNILIDHTGEPKIIDFGVARATELELAAQTMATEAGRIVGTIQYMAPEQLDPGPRDIDARVDVYALGTLLYKLVTGRLPHKLEGLPVYTAIQVVRENEPERPGAIKPELRGDLETIILKALAKDPDRRYRNAGSLGRDLVRYLARKPIHARRASLGYRFRLFCARQRGPIAAVLTIFIIMGAAGGFVMWMRHDHSQRQSALQSQLESERAAREQDEVAPRNEPAPPRDERRASMIETDHGILTALAFDPTGTYLAAGGEDAEVSLWRVGDRQRLFTSDNQDTAPRHLAFSANGSRLVTASRDDRLVLLSTDPPGFDRALRDVCEPMACLALTSDGGTVAYACDDFTLRVRQLDSAAETVIRSTTGAFTAVSFSADGQLVLAGTERGGVYLFDADTGTTQRELPGLNDSVRLIGFIEQDASRIVALSEDGRLAAWTRSDDDDEAIDAAPQVITAIEETVRHAALDARGRRLVCAGDQQVRIWDLVESRLVGGQIMHERYIQALTITPDGGWYAVGDALGEIHIRPIPELPSQAQQE